MLFVCQKNIDFKISRKRKVEYLIVLKISRPSWKLRFKWIFYLSEFDSSRIHWIFEKRHLLIICQYIKYRDSKIWNATQIMILRFKISTEFISYKTVGSNCILWCLFDTNIREQKTYPYFIIEVCDYIWWRFLFGIADPIKSPRDRVRQNWFKKCLINRLER